MNASHRENHSARKSATPSLSLMAVASVLTIVVVMLLFWQRPKDVVGLPLVKLDKIPPTEKSIVEAAIAEIRSRPDDAKTWGRLASILRLHKLEDESVACFKKAEQLDPNDPMWPYLHGSELIGVDNDVALECLRRAAELDKQFASTRVKLAGLLIDMNRLELAEQEIRRALDHEPNNAWAQQQLARVLYRQNSFDESLDWLQRSIANEPRQHSTHELLARVYHRLGQRDDAIKHQELMESLRENRISWFEPLADRSIELLKKKNWYQQEGEALFAQGNLDQAAMKFKEDIENLPEDTLASVHYAVTLLRRREFEAAGSILDRALKRQPNSAELHFNRGVVFFYQKNYSSAEEHFRRAVEIKPTYSNAHANLGHVLEALDDVEGAIDSFREALRHRAESWEAHLKLGMLFVKKGDGTTAIEHLNSAIALMPANHPTRRTAKEVLEKAKLLDATVDDASERSATDQDSSF